jgi:UDP-N-acetylmuramate dehydrogenase
MNYDIDGLNNALHITVETNVPMSGYTSFRTGGCADILLKPNDTDGLVTAVEELTKRKIPCLLLGRCSNVLVSDDGIEGAVILTERVKGIETDGETLYALCGTPLSDLASTAMHRGLGGLEFSAGIPGSVGGAVYMNAGAYGSEIKDVLVSADVYRKGSGVLTLSNAELAFSYRSSSLQTSDDLLLSARFCLKQSSEEVVANTMRDYLSRRKEKQPLEYPSAGSTFKRPSGYFAGKLIEDAGLKGLSSGDAAVSEKHAGFIINRGNATTTDILRLIDVIQEKVEEKFSVRLEPEVRMIGRFFQKE